MNQTDPFLHERIRETPAAPLSRANASSVTRSASTQFWLLWRDSVGGEPIDMRIELASRTPTAGWRTWTEGMGFPRHDCPLAFLDRAPAVERAWRDRVWSWPESQLAADVEKGD